MDTPAKSKGQRVTLTKKHLEEKHGGELLSLLITITKDGVVSEEEAKQLASWLESCNETLPAIEHLKSTVRRILEDGIITPSEIGDLHYEIERVLPLTYREDAQGQRNRVQAELYRTQNAATKAQLDYIKALGGTVGPEEKLTKFEASTMIDELREASDLPISNRQKMVLRFWGKEAPSNWSRYDVSRWTDNLYEEDPLKAMAWDQFKEESDDSGAQSDPERVPWRAGYEYLKRYNSPSGYEEETSVLETIAPHAVPRKSRESAVRPPVVPNESITGTAIFLGLIVLFVVFLILRGCS